MDTYNTKKKDIKSNWYIINAEDQILGRLASNIANILQGKRKSVYTKNINIGDYVIVVNASKIKVTGNKIKNKIYYHYSGYPSGIKKITFKNQLQKDSTEIIRKAVKGMLPKNKLQNIRIKRLKIFIDSNHPYSNKQPKEI